MKIIFLLQSLFNCEILGAKFPRVLCIIVVYVVREVIDVLKFWGWLLYSMPEVISVNNCDSVFEIYIIKRALFLRPSVRDTLQ